MTFAARCPSIALDDGEEFSLAAMPDEKQRFLQEMLVARKLREQVFNRTIAQLSLMVSRKLICGSTKFIFSELTDIDGLPVKVTIEVGA